MTMSEESRLHAFLGFPMFPLFSHLPQLLVLAFQVCGDGLVVVQSLLELPLLVEGRGFPVFQGLHIS